VKKDDERLQAKKKADEFCSQCHLENMQAVCESLVLAGNPAKLIVQIAKDRGVDMILMGGRGKSLMAKMLMGRVTEKVIGRAHCAVLVVTT